MPDWRQATIDTYNQSAKALAEYFRGIGPRVGYIELALLAAGQPDNPKIIEIGCGDGRDAKAIVERTDNYLGFDISKELIKLAKSHVEKGKFEIADAVTFDYPPNQDLVFAFASILHLDKDELRIVLDKVRECLRAGGVFYISSKYAATYTEQLKEDQFGQRLFYFYNAEIVHELAGRRWEIVTEFREVRGRTDWFEMVLRKVS